MESAIKFKGQDIIVAELPQEVQSILLDISTNNNKITHLNEDIVKCVGVVEYLDKKVTPMIEKFLADKTTK